MNNTLNFILELIIEGLRIIKGLVTGKPPKRIAETWSDVESEKEKNEALGKAREKFGTDPSDGSADK